ncbi:alpha/beta-hydrolase family protein [Lapillicoccus sp.]|uniref:alpha/beta-hydrolase family protein n=1 Tax=Lapillicoccus sp. TaxID=1909287 RepID=UPI00326476BF
MIRLAGPAHTISKVLLGDSSAGRAAALMATAAAGASFTPGLMPRGRREQIVATGIASALQHGLVINAHARHEVLSNLICSWAGRGNDPVGRRQVKSAVALGTTVAGLAAYAALPARHGERIERAVVRTVGVRLFRVGTASLLVGGADLIDRRYGQDHPLVRTAAPAAGFLAGAAISAALIRRFRKFDPVIAARVQASVDPLTRDHLNDKPDHGEPVTSLPVSLALGVGVATSLQLLSGVEGYVSGRVATSVRRVIPGSDPYASLVAHAVMLSGLVGVLAVGIEYVYHRAEAGGSAIDAAYTTAPNSPSVSGGPNSAIGWQTLSREGVRFVAMSLNPQEIADVTHTPLEQVTTPIRCFAGLDSASTVGARVGLVMEDLERLGAFQRSVICLTSPTGTGYVNYVAVETLEYLTRGDCATVGIQYSLRPSFLSLDRVAMAREQNLALLNALVWRIRGLPEGKRPRLVGFGESLGAQTLQNCFLHEGVGGLQRAGIDGALFLGTPAASRWASEWRSKPSQTDPDGQVIEVSGFDQWSTATAGRTTKPKYVLLSNPEDPIVKFTPRIAVARPEWLPLRAQRPPGVPQAMLWMPYTTMLITLIDVVNALEFVPGVFVARGHDYRASIPRMVSETYRLPVDDDEMTRIEHALRDRERTWAQKRMVAEQLARAGEAVGRQLRTWGEVSSPPTVAAP